MTPCTEWGKYKNARGYGVQKLYSKPLLAHRVAYAQRHGLDVLTMGGVVMHSCDNPGCVNPDHLSMGTDQLNMDDMYDKGRDSHPKAEDHPRSKLTCSIVRRIRDTYVPRHPEYGDAAFARLYGVATAVIRNARVGKTWKEA